MRGLDYFMCGIGGYFIKPKATINPLPFLDTILATQNHRGPDSQGKWSSVDNHVGLAHNRLAIVDLSSAGHQPMHSRDGRYTITYNGEIYNWPALRQDLAQRGVVFQSQTDTEIIMELYRHYGVGFLEKLRGMFAFALYDHQTNELICARDRVGKKPFVYTENANGFAFASEIPPLLHWPNVDKAINHAAIAGILLHNMRHVPDPYTAYRGIMRLPAGHYMIVRAGVVVAMQRYWSPPTEQVLATTPKALCTLLREAVEIRMMGDVPIGALLSGGVDSTAIVAMMQRRAHSPIKTYALGMDADDEDLRRARLMATRLGTDHKEFYFDAAQQWDVFKNIIHTYGEPIALLPMVHTHTLCAAIQADGVKVVLNGNGADELFYGYNGHVNTARLSMALSVLSPLARLLPMLPSAYNQTKISRLLLASPSMRKAALYESYAQHDWGRVCADDMWPKLANYTVDAMQKWGAVMPDASYIDHSNFIGLMVENTHSVTTIGDLPAMMHGIEMRSPFLDQRLIDFAFQTPAWKKVPLLFTQNRLKQILRRAVQDYVPPDILSAPKRGFGFGIQERDVLAGLWQEQARDILLSPNDCDGLLDNKKINHIWQEFLSGTSQHASLLMRVLAIKLWDQRR